MRVSPTRKWYISFCPGCTKLYCLLINLRVNFILVFLEVLANHSVFLQFGFRTCFSFREEINCHEFKLLMAESEIGLFHLDVHNISGRENS